jgi:hypothetical protein
MKVTDAMLEFPFLCIQGPDLRGRAGRIGDNGATAGPDGDNANEGFAEIPMTRVAVCEVSWSIMKGACEDEEPDSNRRTLTSSNIRI